MKTREELIQDYIDRVLSAEDQDAFDNLWETDSSFQEEVGLQQELHAVLRKRLLADDGPLRQTLGDAEKSFRTEKGKIWVWRRWIIPIAAAACLLILGRLFLFPGSYYQLPEMLSEIVRGDINSEKNQYEQAVRAFNEKDYVESTKILKQLLSEDSSVLQYQYYLGLSLIGEKKFEEATQYLLPLADGESVFQHEANYYVAVAYIEGGQEEKAKQRLEMIGTSSKIYDKAQKLLKKLR